MTDVHVSPGLSPWRPIQYLGCKLRTLGQVVDTVRDLSPEGGYVWEPFAGSTVVSQGLAQAGYRVWAGDALLSSATFAEALLGVGRPKSDEVLLSRIAIAIADRARHVADQYLEIWHPWVDVETDAIASNKSDELLQLVSSLPQRWRPTNADASLMRLFGLVEVEANEGATRASGLLSATYAGTYFGLRQAAELEAIRGEIDAIVCKSDEASRWLRSGLLTALCHAGSAAVFSPGKHFAQPHKIHSGKDLAFHRRRILHDRSVSVNHHFVEAASQIEKAARAGQEHHHAYCQRVEDVTTRDLVDAGINVVYADPPYTAQQYSRFYHLLEVLVRSVPAKLQMIRGRVTSGLYPVDRYLSPYCSRSRAGSAIADLARKSASAGASLVLSYSGTVSQKTGNARSLDLDEIVRQMQSAYGDHSVSVLQLPLNYRQFNRSSLGVTGRNDPEFVVVGSFRRLDAR